MAIMTLFSGTTASADERPDTLTLFNAATFYDGYLFQKNPDSLVSDGILRHSTSLYAVKLKPEQLALIGDSLRMNVFVQTAATTTTALATSTWLLYPRATPLTYPTRCSALR